MLVGVPLIAQQSSAPNPPSVLSPEVQSDGHVTLRYYDPDAHNVVVRLEGAKDPLPMQKGENSVWTATTGVLEPEIYGYSFEADGMHRLDPVNSLLKPNLLMVSNMVEVPGSSPMPWDQADIPHGRIDHHFYKSEAVGDNRDYFVYTPPGYDTDTSKRYPVLYLLHGYSDDASGWTAVGKANLILDTLIHSGQAAPMIVVMPLGYGTPSIVSRNPAARLNNAALRDENYSKFQLALLNEVLPKVEGAYRVNADRNERAIAGLSMGGAESLLTGLNHLDKFAWIGAFSAGGLGTDFAAAFPHVTSADNQQIRLLWIACGTEDRLITPNRELESWLKQKGVDFTPIETPGMHTWMVWRNDLVHFAPLLFKSPTTTAEKR
jgi:enterochelin esterase family protein